METRTRQALIVALILVGVPLALRTLGFKWYAMEVAGNGVAYRMDRITGRTCWTGPGGPWAPIPESEEEYQRLEEEEALQASRRRAEKGPGPIPVVEPLEREGESGEHRNPEREVAPSAEDIEDFLNRGLSPGDPEEKAREDE